MSTVLNHLCKHPVIAHTLSGLTLLPEGTDDVMAVAGLILEEEPETKAFEECHIILRFKLAPAPASNQPTFKLEVLRWSTEHGDHEPISLPIEDLQGMQSNLKKACQQLGCLLNSHQNGLPLLRAINSLCKDGAIETSQTEAA